MEGLVKHLLSLYSGLMKTPEQAWAEQRKTANLPRLAKHLAIKRQAPYGWKAVPPTRCLAVAAFLGVKPSDLRPDLYPPED